MEFRSLTASDLPSLLELYHQLDENDDQCDFEQSKRVWEEIEDNSNIQMQKSRKLSYLVILLFCHISKLKISRV